MSRQYHCAAIVYGPSDDVDAALAGVVEVLRNDGRTVGGLLQRFGAQIAPGKREMLVRVLPGETIIRLNDQRGSGVQGCILDADALARAAMAFHEAALAGPDLLLAGRFGKQEAAGSGLRAELAEVLLAGTPMLVPMRNDMLAAWAVFLGAPAEVLSPQTDKILAWVNRMVGVPTSLARRRVAGVA